MRSEGNSGSVFNTVFSLTKEKGNWKISKVDELIDQVNSLSIAYQSYEDKQRFVPKASQITALPIQDFKILRPIEANTVIQVLDAAQCQDQQLWLYVSVPVYDTPINFKGWIPESETVKLTEDNVKLIQGDVFLKEGTPYSL